MYKNPRSHAAALPPLLSNPTHPPPPPPLTGAGVGHESHYWSFTSFTLSPLRRIMLAAASWLRMRRSRCFFLLLCSPILLPILCATFPLLCAAELCIRICRRSRSRRRRKDGDDEEENDRIRRCEEGFCDCDGGLGEDKEIGLLQRYLEDQLRLVGSVYECGDEFDEQEEEQEQEENITQIQNQNRNIDLRTPLLA